MSDVLQEYSSIIKKQYPKNAEFTVNLDKVTSVEDIVKILKASHFEFSFTNPRIIEEYDIGHLVDVDVDDYDR